MILAVQERTGPDLMSIFGSAQRTAGEDGRQVVWFCTRTKKHHEILDNGWIPRYRYTKGSQFWNVLAVGKINADEISRRFHPTIPNFLDHPFTN